MEASVSIMSSNQLLALDQRRPKERKLCIDKRHIFTKNAQEVLVRPVSKSEPLLTTGTEPILGFRV